MNSVPAENTKSAPKTERIAEGNPYAQYDWDGRTTAKNTLAQAVDAVPSTVQG